MISIIIPIYNSGLYLRDCIYSIIDIKMEKEIILVNDGSTDSSSAFCVQLIKKYPDIKYFTKNNGGAASARNAGLKHARGEYVVFVDSDDTLDLKWSDTVSKAMNEKSDMYVYGMAFDYCNNEKLIKTELLSNRYSGVAKREEIENNFADYFNNNTLSSTCNKVFRKDIIDKYNIRFNENMNHYEDLDFVLQYLSHIETVYYIPDALYHYRLNLNNDHINSRVKDLRNVIHNLDNLANTVSKVSNKSTVHSVLSNLYISILISNIMVNDYSKDTMRELLDGYCDNDNIRKEELTNENKRIYEMIKNREFSRLYSVMRRKKAKSTIKRAIKSLIGK